jgi:prepilin-type N-terminal cleavage/methylation domain-containing protein
MRHSLQQRKQSGFTIIEVLIVLAIAGLIMLVVFLAVPALQRNQRNTARKAEASRIVTAIGECVANKNGVTAQCDTPAELGFAGGTLPTTEYNELTSLTYSTAPASATNSAVIYHFANQCDSTADGMSTGTTRQYAVAYKYEAGGGNSVWSCING